MFSPRFFALACAATIWVGLSVAWQQHPLTDKQLREMGYDPIFEGPLPYVGDPYADPNIYILNIDFTTEEAAKKSHVYLKYLTGSDPNNSWNSRALVREVHVKGQPELGDLSLVKEVFWKLENLDRVYWEYPGDIPISILQSIEKNNPSCRLYYSFQGLDSGSGPNYKKAERDFIHSPNLYSVKVDINYGPDDNLYDIDFVFNILSTAPNIKELDMYLHHESCGYGGINPYAFDFDSHPGARFAPLEVLRLNGYDLLQRTDGGYERYFNGSGWSHRWARGARSNGKYNLHAWGEAMDWSQLHTLDLTHPLGNELNTLQYDIKLPVLRDLTIETGRLYFIHLEAISLATNTTKPLEALSFKNFNVDAGNTLIDNLTSIPAALSELEHFSFIASDSNPQDLPFLPQERISKLISSSPKLEKLDLHIPRSVNMTPEHEPFKSFAESPTLKQLTLRFPSTEDFAYEMADGSGMLVDSSRIELWAPDENQTATLARTPDPLVNKDTALKLFKELRAAKEGDELEKLDIFVGSWDHRFRKRWSISRRIKRIALWKCWVVDWPKEEKCEGEQTTMDI